MTEKKPALDVGDEEQVRKQKTKTQIAREREIHELKEILGTYGGRAFVWRSLVQCKSVPGMDFIGTHPQGTFRELGQQDHGRWLTNEVFTSDSEAYSLMWQEAEERKKHG